MARAEQELPHLITSEDILPHLWACFNGSDRWVFLTEDWNEGGCGHVHHLAVCCHAAGMDVKWGYVGWKNLFPEQKVTVMFLTVPKGQFDDDDVNLFLEKAVRVGPRVKGTGRDVVTLLGHGSDPHTLIRFMKSVLSGEHRAITAAEFSQGG
jgi:hypothetical protein